MLSFGEHSAVPAISTREGVRCEHTDIFEVGVQQSYSVCSCPYNIILCAGCTPLPRVSMNWSDTVIRMLTCWSQPVMCVECHPKDHMVMAGTLDGTTYFIDFAREYRTRMFGPRTPPDPAPVLELFLRIPIVISF